MKLVFTYETDEKIHGQLGTLKEMTQRLEVAAKSESSIAACECIYIKLIIQEQVEGFESFSKASPPFYKEKKVEKNPLFGDKEYNGYLMFDCLLSPEAYQTILARAENATQHLLIREINQQHSMLSDYISPKELLEFIDSNAIK
ncbi:hypothetical protein [Alteromonas sp. OM2203]|uniref:hypothetical protein n=1 Tax=Alteromonas sp. OM2203 TaxID=3398817 RepID=UPI003AF3C7CD